MVPPGTDLPEQRARQKIDAALAASGWVVQNRDDMNVSAGRGVAVREFKLAAGYGFADYLLFSVIDTAEKAVVAQSKRVARLRQSVLKCKWAFEGKLVDQDPDDEPASALLARIKAEQPTITPKAAPRARRKATTA